VAASYSFIAMPSYKLYYFNVKGRAEPSRLLFAYAGVEYEDVRVESKDWPSLKKSKFSVFIARLFVVY